MADHHWKRRERQAAALFGCRRNVCSGSSNRDDRDSSDSTHEWLYIETKTLAKTAVRTLWAKTRRLAHVADAAPDEAHKAPVLVIYDKGKAGGLVVTHEDDLPDVLVAYAAAMDRDELMAFGEAVRKRREGDDDGSAS